MSRLTVFQCDGCDLTEQVIEGQAPTGVLPVEVVVTALPGKERILGQGLDLCDPCRAKLLGRVQAAVGGTSEDKSARLQSVMERLAR